MVDNDGTAGRSRVPNRQELRLALAMKGGLSLAVWIGGAASEVDRLRVATTAPESGPDRHPWRRLAELVGYRSVRIDVLTGASAGGLNGTVLAASMVYGFPFENMREVWIGLADIEALTRDTRMVLEGPPPLSLLDGDGYFESQLRTVLTEQVALAPTRPQVDRLDLLLTATLSDPITETRFDDRRGELLETRCKGSFRFRHFGKPGDPLSDFHSGAAGATTAARLALAGRSTSAFPFAFEPGTVHSVRTPVPGTLDMSRVFSELSADSRPFHVIDGGVLDNIPVAAAIRAIAASPADAPTERWLLYLHPDPKTRRDQVRGAPRRAVSETINALLTRYGQESVLQDIDELERHNARAELSRMRLRAAFAPLLEFDGRDPVERLSRLAWTVRATHATIRAATDAEQLTALLTGRTSGLGLATLPREAGEPLADWPDDLRRALPGRLTELIGRRAADPAAVFFDVIALGSAIDLCIGWTRELERWAVGADLLARIGTAKSALYLLRFLHELLAEFSDRQVLRAAGSARVPPADELDAWIDDVLERRRRAAHRLPVEVGAALDEVLGRVRTPSATDPKRVDHGFQAALADFADTLLDVEDRLAEPGRVDAVSHTWYGLIDVINELAGGLATRIVIDAEGQPELLGYQLLASCHDDRRQQVLTDLVVLSAPVSGLGAGDRIRFLAIGGDTDSPIPFDALRDGSEPLRTAAKLCGTELGAFAAFWSARWRANDWMWGRLDAAANLVTLLLDAERLRLFNPDPDAAVAAIAEIVTSPPRTEVDHLPLNLAQEWERFLVRRWAERSSAVTEEIHDAYRRPHQPHPLPATVAAVTERIQWGVLAAEVPFVNVVRTGAHTDPIQRPAAPAPGSLEPVVNRYDVGRTGLRDLSERRVGRIAVRLTMVTYRVVRPGSTWGWRSAAQLLGAITKPWALLIVLLVAAPRRTVLALATALAGTLPAVWGPYETWSTLPWSADVAGTVWDEARLICGVLVVGLIVIAGTQFVVGYRRRRADMLEPTLAITVLLLGLVAAVLGERFGPLLVTAAGACAFWLALFWTRVESRAILTGSGTIVGYLATAGVFVALDWKIGWWMVLAPVVAMYTTTGLASILSVFPPRPRPGEAAPQSVEDDRD